MRARIRAMVGAIAVGASVAASAGGQGDSPYIRVVDQDSATIRLDVAVRVLAPDDGHGPLVNLVGAIHIGDQSFYDSVQALLDVHDVVLYEGVGGEREAAEEPRGDEAAAVLTERRVRFLAVLAADVHRREGEYPASGEALAESVGGAMGVLAAGAMVDGWGEPLAFEPGPGFDIVSLGADEREGGSGEQADVRASELLRSARVVATAGESAGLQRDLADALGLVFQMDGIDYSHAHWRNSDLSVGEIQEALGGGRADEGDGPVEGAGQRLDDDAPESLKAADLLFRTLSGESFLAKASGFLLKMMGSSPSGRAMVKIMLADTLTHAEDLLAMQPGAMAELMKVIVEDRNGAVVRDLRGVVEDEPGVESVAVFYGAGHFGDLEARICEELGYRHESTLWVPAMTIDIAEAGLSAQQVGFFRKMMREMIETQLRALDGREGD